MQKPNNSMSLSAFLVAILFPVLIPSLIWAQETIDLKVEFPKSTEVRITSDYHHNGTVLVVADGSDKVETLELNVDAKLGYHQRMLSAEQAMRFYDTANATIKLGKGKTKPKLSASNNLVVARSKATGQQVEMASVKDSLNHEELKLIQNPADPLTLATILTKPDVKVGDKWEPNLVALAKLLSVHEIKESDVKLTLKNIDKLSARVFLAGSVSADVDDVTTQMDVSGIAFVDRRTNLPTSFKISIRETKDPGQINPGFEGTTKIDLRFKQAKPIKQLSNEALASHTKNGKIRQRLKWVSRFGGFNMLYDPRWKMINEDQEAALLRYIEGTDVLAQCQAVTLPKRPPTKPLTLDVYKKEIGKIVDSDKNAKLASSATTRSSTGNTVLTVVVSGVEDGLPVSWFYYNVAHKDGRQVAFVFTLDGALSSRVTPIANQLINEFEFKAVTKKVANAKSKKPANQTSRKR